MKTSMFAPVRACVLTALFGVLMSACGEAPTQVEDTDILALPVVLDPGGVPANATPYNTLGHCSSVVVIDPGTVTVKNGIRMERNVVAECPLTGDITGTVRFTRNSTVRNGDGPLTEWDGPVWGQTFLLVDEFYGETGFSGTFEGPYSTDWQNLLFGTGRSNRRGTGDFRGLTMVGTTHALPGFLVDEDGFIHGNLGGL